jgi:hypothetical protein
MEKEKCEENKEDERRGSDEGDKFIKLLFSFDSILMQLRNPIHGNDISLVTRICKDGFTLL